MELKPLEECTPSQREFIGSTFPTPKGGVLTVVGCCREKSGSNALFKVECSICSEDTELFPKGFSTTKRSIKKGSLPCGCSGGYRWVQDQHRVRVVRECIKRGYIFQGWAEDFKNTFTKVKLHNPATNYTWETTSIASFLKGGSNLVEGMKKASLSSRKTDTSHVEDFMKTGSFLKGTTFTRNKDRAHYWDVTCPKCSSDEYAKMGLCSGIFTCHRSHLKRGCLACRCAVNYKLTPAQKEYKIKKVCLKEGVTFIKFISGFDSASEKVNWVCAKDHECITSTRDFLRGRRCKTCGVVNNNGEFGFYKDRTKEQDYLYIYKIKGQPYIKVGRSFEPDKRLIQNQTRINKYYGNKKHKITQTHLFTGTHEEIYNLEQDILSKEFVSHSVDLGDGYGSSELLREDCYEDVVAFCESVVEEVRL